jgi:hypothetical protein
MLARYARERLDVRWMDAALLSSLHGRGGEMLRICCAKPIAAASFLDNSPPPSRPPRRCEMAHVSQGILHRAGTTAAILTSLAQGRAHSPTPAARMTPPPPARSPHFAPALHPKSARRAQSGGDIRPVATGRRTVAGLPALRHR